MSMFGICPCLTTSKNENQVGVAQPRAQNEHVLVAGGVNSFPYFMCFETLINLGISLNLVHGESSTAEPGDLYFSSIVHDNIDHALNALVAIDHSTRAQLSL